MTGDGPPSVLAHPRSLATASGRAESALPCFFVILLFKTGHLRACSVSRIASLDDEGLHGPKWSGQRSAKPFDGKWLDRPFGTVETDEDVVDCVHHPAPIRGLIASLESFWPQVLHGRSLKHEKAKLCPYGIEVVCAPLG